MTSTIPVCSGIYRITCVPNGKIYIGSAINLQSRWRVHRHHLSHGTHHSITFQRAWNKYGEACFIFEVVEFVLLPDMLIAREQHWLDTYTPFDPTIGYNIDRVAGSRYGATVSPETREKLRQANLGKQHSEETKRKLAIASGNRTQSEATKEKVRQIRLGTKRSDESRERSRLSHLGKKPTQETREKMKLASTGHTTSEETRARISASNIAGNEWRMKTLIVTSPEGETFTIHGIGQFCKEHNLNRSALTQVAKGNARHHKGWAARFPED